MLKITSLPVSVFAISVFLMSCPAESDQSSSQQDQPSQPTEPAVPTPSEIRTAELSARYEAFSTIEGDCEAAASFTLELGDGKERIMTVSQAYAQPKLAITSLKGDVVTTRSGSAFTLHFSDYALDLEDIGANPEEGQSKLELVLITKDKGPVSVGTYRTAKKGNLVAGPNLFYGGKTYPMKDNFVGGVQVTSIEDGYVCGEIRVRSKFDVSIMGTFRAKLLEPIEAE